MLTQRAYWVGFLSDQRSKCDVHCTEMLRLMYIGIPITRLKYSPKAASPTILRNMHMQAHPCNRASPIFCSLAKPCVRLTCIKECLTHHHSSPAVMKLGNYYINTTTRLTFLLSHLLEFPHSKNCDSDRSTVRCAS